MGLTYREDDDLAFLKRCDNQDLELLFTYLTRRSDGDERITQALLSEPLVKRMLQRSNPDYRAIWNLLAAELQLYGGNTVVNLFRGNGVIYREILQDVCSRLNVDFNPEDNVFEIENAMLQHVLEESWDDLSEEDRRTILEESGLDAGSIDGGALESLLKHMGVAGVMSFVFSRYLAQAAAIRFAGAAGVGALGAGAMAALVNWAGAIFVLLQMAAGPAYRVTVPCVIQIAYMRLKAVTEVCI